MAAALDICIAHVDPQRPAPRACLHELNRWARDALAYQRGGELLDEAYVGMYAGRCVVVLVQGPNGYVIPNARGKLAFDVIAQRIFTPIATNAEIAPDGLRYAAY